MLPMNPEFQPGPLMRSATRNTPFAPLHVQGKAHVTNIQSISQTQILDPQNGKTAGPARLINTPFKDPDREGYKPALKDGLPFTGHPTLSGANSGLLNGGILVAPFLAPDSPANAQLQA